ncbi:MAG: helix-turn-helix domain-containing protein [Balneolaceae bacterium]|nr:helix-turn-helix domain-containing protein [Balneolaceae bacterium]
MPYGHRNIDNILQEYRKSLAPPEEDWPFDVQLASRCLNKRLYDESLNVTELKELCGIQSRNFSARFRYYTGEYPKDFLIRHRIAAAKRVLTSDTYNGSNLMELALSLGFRSHSSFTKAYRSREGVAPSKHISSQVKSHTRT